jgi:formate hydrogenlyase subunit 3/multisubunit Na+/H+ antiporter MnhD subunit
MTIDNWLMIALIITSFIAQLIAPTLAELVKSRINQPKPTPDPNQPKNLSQRIGGWVIQASLSPWVLPPLAIAIDIWILVLQVRNVGPITRGSVVAMSTAVAGGFFTLLNMSLLNTGQIVRAQSRNRAKETLEMFGLLKDMIDCIKLLNRAVIAVPASSSEKPADGVTARMMATIKRLLQN